MTDSGAIPPSAGVRGAAVEKLDEQGLRCFYSVLDSLGGDPEALKRDALEFHPVTRELFRQAAIIPFRFPTTLDSVAQVGAYIRDHAPAYRAALTALHGQVQMEIRISPSEPAAGVASSGTAYLQTRAERGRRLEQAVAACRVGINAEVIDWHQRESSHGVRCFVLIRREAVKGFQEQIQQVRLDPGITATLSGPWPPTDFLPAFDD